MKGAFDQDPEAFQHVGGPLVGLFPFTTMFVVTSITMLRERTTGTLERLMSLPLAKLDLLFGYAIAFALIGGRAGVGRPARVAFGLLGLDVAGSAALVVALAVGNALLGMSLGLFVSAFARTEFQAVQFMPAIVFPAAAALRAVRRPRHDGRHPPGRIGPDAAHLRLRCARPGDHDGVARVTRRPRRGGDRRRNVAAAGARRRHPAPPYAVSG